MELKQAFEMVMQESIHIALATSVDGQPNVRIVTFAWDQQRPGKLFFSTFKGNRKTEEFAQNPKVVCMPLPVGPEAAAQVRIFGAAQKSTLPVSELAVLVGKKAPEDAETLNQGGDLLEVYEICFDDAWLTLGMSDAVRYPVNV